VSTTAAATATTTTTTTTTTTATSECRSWLNQADRCPCEQGYNRFSLCLPSPGRRSPFLGIQPYFRSGRLSANAVEAQRHAATISIEEQITAASRSIIGTARLAGVTA
jgi:hypothetical protein